MLILGVCHPSQWGLVGHPSGCFFCFLFLGLQFRRSDAAYVSTCQRREVIRPKHIYRLGGQQHRWALQTVPRRQKERLLHRDFHLQHSTLCDSRMVRPEQASRVGLQNGRRWLGRARAIVRMVPLKVE
jgi:hypothetical protein